MDFNNFDNFGGGNSQRDKLEIGDSGKTRGEEKREKGRNRPITGRGSRFGGRGRKGGGLGRGVSTGFKVIGNIIFWSFLILVLYLLNLNYQWVDLDFNKKMTQEEGYATLINSTKDVHRDAGINSGMVEELDEVYEYNNIFDGSSVYDLPEDVYLSYPYTLSDKDELFNLFIESYGEDVPVYPLDIESIGVDIGYNYLEYTDSRRFEDPHFIMYSRVEGAENEPVGIYFEEDLENLVTDFNSLLTEHQNKDEWR